MLNVFFKSVVVLFIIAIGVFVWPLLTLFWFAETWTFRDLDKSAQVGALLLLASIQVAWLFALTFLAGDLCVDSTSVWC